MSVNIYDSTTQTLTRVDEDANFTGATSSAAGTSGSVPAPAAGDQNKILKGDASWTEYNGSTLKTKTAQSGSSQSSVESSIAANTSLDSAVGTLLNNDATIKQALTSAIEDYGVVNVVAFGAKGDGVTDDTAAIKAAIAYAQSSKYRTVYFPKGNYLISDTLQLMTSGNQNISLRGSAEWSAILRRANGFTGDLIDTGISGGTPIGGFCQISNLRIENGGASGTYINCPTAFAIKMRTRGVIENVYIVDGGNGIEISSTETQLINVHYLQTFQYSALYPSTYGLKYTGVISDNYVVNSSFVGQDRNSANNLSHALYIDGSDGLQIVNCSLNANRAIEIVGNTTYPTDDIYFGNCIMDNGLTYNVKMSGNGNNQVNVRFVGCHFNNCDNNSVVIENFKDVTIEACNFQLIQGSAIYLNSANDILIDGNIFDYCALGAPSSSPVNTSSTGANGVIVSGNIFGNNTAQYDVNASNMSNAIITNNLFCNGGIYGTASVNANNHVRT